MTAAKLPWHSPPQLVSNARRCLFYKGGKLMDGINATVTLVASPYKTLKPLIWEDYSSVDYPTRLCARVLEFDAYVWQQDDRFWFAIGQFCTAPGAYRQQANSAEHGKQLAWDYHRRQVAELFEADVAEIGER